MISSRHRILAAFAVAASFASAHTAQAATYEVGEGQVHTAIGHVPWESLQPGDVVRIHWRQTPYKEKWVIAVRGTESAPITIQGVANASGERPVIDGRDATTRSALNYWNERRGVIKIGGANTPATDVAAWIVVEGLDIRSGRSPYSFTGRDGSDTYADNAAALYIEAGENIVLRNNVFRDSGNGLFIGASDGATKNITVAQNYIYDNGINDSIYQHNSYTAAIDIVFEANRYGPLRTGCLGNNLKDRSAGLVVRYNWIESGNRQLDLVDAEDSPVLVSHPRYNETFVYGNVLVEREGDGNSQMVHYGGDSGTESDYRKGTLYFYNNTLLSTRSGNTTLVRLSSNGESADIRNNIVHTTAGGGRLGLITSTGTATVTHNCLPDGYKASHESSPGTVNDDATSVDSTTPGFMDMQAGDLRLGSGSPCIDGAGAQAPATLAAHGVARQYISHQRSEPRVADGPLDLGAIEHCAGSCTPPDPDAGTTGDADGGPGADGGAAGDGGTTSGDGESGGCGCSGQNSGGSSGWLVLVLVVAAGIGRRSRPTPC